MINSKIMKEVMELEHLSDVEERIDELVIGHELDETFAIEFLDMEYVEETQEVEISPANKIETNYVSTKSGKPAFLPNVSTDNNLAVMVLKDMHQDFTFEYIDNKFVVPFEDIAEFEGHTLGEAVMKALLFGKTFEASKGGSNE